MAAICGLAGILVTWVFVPNVTGEDLGQRDEKFRQYLVDNGWDGMMGEEDLQGLAEDIEPVANESAVNEKVAVRD